MIKKLFAIRMMSLCLSIGVALIACLVLVAASDEHPISVSTQSLSADGSFPGVVLRSSGKEDSLPVEKKSYVEGVGAKFNASIYSPLEPLGQQLPELRAQARRGNTYATCVLATALDSCVEQMMGSIESPWKDLSSGDAIEKGDDRQVEKFSAELEKHKAQEFMCANVTQNDMLERDAWLLQSAKSGNPISMARFALNPDFAGVMRLDDMDRMIEYRKSAESMLNRSADAGVQEAILGVYRAYSDGAIGTSVGTLKVDTDPAKAVGAARAVLPFLDEAERREIESRIGMMIAKMDKTQQGRMVSTERAYKKAYESRASAGMNLQDSRKANSPEAVCSEYAK